MPLIQQSGEVYRPPARIRPELVRPLGTVAREAIESALILCGGNRKLAARRLGISRETLQRKIAAYRLEDARGEGVLIEMRSAI